MAGAQANGLEAVFGMVVQDRLLQIPALPANPLPCVQPEMVRVSSFYHDTVTLFFEQVQWCSLAFLLIEGPLLSGRNIRGFLSVVTSAPTPLCCSEQ